MASSFGIKSITSAPSGVPPAVMMTAGAWVRIEAVILKHDPWCRGVVLLGLGRGIDRGVPATDHRHRVAAGDSAGVDGGA